MRVKRVRVFTSKFHIAGDLNPVPCFAAVLDVEDLPDPIKDKEAYDEYTFRIEQKIKNMLEGTVINLD